MSVHSMENQETSLDNQRSFWEVGQYRRTVKRCDDGYKVSNELITLLAERAEIEKKYAKSLKTWSKKWNDFLDKGPEYGTNKSAWKATLTEADRKCELHRDIGTKLQDQVVTNIKVWQKENYHKKMMNGFKETIELDEGFRKAQKQWAQLLKKVQAAQAKYYTCSKQQKTAEIQEKAAEGDSTLSPDQIKKLQDKNVKCRQDTIKAREKYQSSLDDINEHNPRYMEDMTLQFNKGQDFEKKRLSFFRQTFIDIHKVLDLSTTDKFIKVYTEYMNSLQNSDPEKDLKWWKANHGIGMSMTWPAFEEYSDQLHAISKKSSKGNVGGTGPDGIVVSSYRSTSEFSNQDYNDPTYNSNNIDSWESYDSYSRQSSNTSARQNSQGPDANDNDFNYEVEENGDLTNKPGVKVRALYDYTGIEEDELTFHSGVIFDKLEDEDEQGWCQGRVNGKIGLYPANYAEEV